jgi:ABC-type uncharacterized transport system auxiliary subunit
MSQKRPLDVYSVMLLLATIFMLFACIFMGIEYGRS